MRSDAMRNYRASATDRSVPCKIVRAGLACAAKRPRLDDRRRFIYCYLVLQSVCGTREGSRTTDNEGGKAPQDEYQRLERMLVAAVLSDIGRAVQDTTVIQKFTVIQTPKVISNAK